MGIKKTLNQYASDHNIHYRTALRNFKDMKLAHVSEYITVDDSKKNKYFVIDESKKDSEVIDKVTEIVDEAYEKIKQVKELLNQKN